MVCRPSPGLLPDAPFIVVASSVLAFLVGLAAHRKIILLIVADVVALAVVVSLTELIRRSSDCGTRRTSVV
jgi:hypothetical protein